MVERRSENLVKKYLEDLNIISEKDYLYDIYLDEEIWDIYKLTSDTLFFVRYELTDDKIGYAFCAKFSVKKLSWECESACYVKTYTNELKKEWEIEDYIKNQLLSNTISILNPYNN